MANSMFLGATLRLKYITGLNDKSEPIFVTKSYRNLNSSHTAENLLAIASAIASLSSHPLDSVTKQETTDLS
ncbi:DUF1659 domain-containing protein [Lysinibacillus sp. NPDC096418]|uniref:DUF1659 domain-containing protein n=1 Tax=Lysinibacillus sp. NPDC096418 TaxID=3364138 RepID=UPI0037FEC32D